MPTYPWSTLPFAEAIAYFKAKRNIDTDTWKDLQAIEWDAVFAVAGAKGHLLQDMREAVEKAIAEGQSIAQFRQDFDRIVAVRGWDYQGDRDWRTAIIYSTNVRSAYAAGRWEQIQKVKSDRPYLQWRHGGSREPRILHRALDKAVFAVDDPFWSSFQPPHGFGCRCSVFSLSDRDLIRLKLKVEKGPAIGSTYKGALVEPEPGWTGHGRTSPDDRKTLIANLTQRLHPKLAIAIENEVSP
jgi:SPP1 gp7 family putative phage head morphogenesis protein